MGDKFKFELDQPIRFKITSLPGVVIGRAEYARSNPSYLIAYADRNGRFLEDWVSEEQLEPAL